MLRINEPAHPRRIPDCQYDTALPASKVLPYLLEFWDVPAICRYAGLDRVLREFQVPRSYAGIPDGANSELIRKEGMNASCQIAANTGKPSVSGW